MPWAFRFCTTARILPALCCNCTRCPVQCNDEYIRLKKNLVVTHSAVLYPFFTTGWSDDSASISYSVALGDTVNIKSESMWKKAVMAYFKVGLLSGHLFGGTKEIHENPRLESRSLIRELIPGRPEY